MRTYVSKIGTVVSLVVLGLIGFSLTAHAADAATSPDAGWLDYARPVYEQIMAGHYIAATAFALVLAMALLKGYAGKVSTKVEAFVHSDIGGTITTFGMSFFGAIATATMATGSGWAGLSLSVFKTSSVVALAAIGGYTAIKKIAIPFLSPYIAKGPAWLRAAWSVALWIFDKPDPVTNAEQAGNAAVAANPAPGSSNITGQPDKF